MPNVRQKPLGIAHADPYNKQFSKGAHMPLCVFLQDNKNAHRSMGGWQHKHETWQERNEASDGNVHRPAREAEAQGKGKKKPKFTHGSGAT